ncbi:MAG: ABC transporter permease [Methanosarcinaceae archaeon]|nr:ABC transporter permease [Methanosarcinaceae archaeon]
MAKRKGRSRTIQTIAKKEYRELMHERTFVLSVIIQLFIASFSTFLVIGLTSFYDPMAMGDIDIKGTRIAIIESNNSDLYSFIENSGITPLPYADFTRASSAFYDRRVDAILLVSDGPPDGHDLINIDLYLPRSDIKATLVSMQLKEPLEEFEQTVRDIRTKRLDGYTPLDINFIDDKQQTSSTYFEFIYVALLPLLMFTPAFISGGLVIDLITEEFEKKTIDLLLVAPVSLLDVINGKVLLTAIIAPIQSLAWMLLLMANDIVIHNPIQILALVLVISFVLVLVSSIISVWFRERGVGQLYYSLVLIAMFLASYLFTNSPLNLVTRLSLQSISVPESVGWIVLYTMIALVLYAMLHRSIGKYNKL